MRTTFQIALMLGLLSVLGCVNGGTVVLPDGETIQVAGTFRTLGEDEAPGDPLSAIDIALVVGLDGIASESATAADGTYRFDLPEGEYHLGIMLPAGFGGSSAPATTFLIHFTVGAEPVGVDVSLLVEEDEGAYHLDIHVFDDEDASGTLTGEEATLEDIEVDVPYGSRADLVVNPPLEDGAPPSEDGAHHH